MPDYVSFPYGLEVRRHGGAGTGSASFGPASTRFWLFNRQYQYIYLHAQAGEGRTIAEHYTAMSAKEDAILTALVALDIADVDVMNVSTSDYGIRTDPSGTEFLDLPCP